MRLLLVELRRFASRRAVAVVLLLAAGLVALMAVSTLYGSRPPTDTERAAAQEALASEEQAYARDLADCRRDPERRYGAGATVADCDQAVPRVEWYYEREPLDLGQELTDTGTVMLVLLGVVGVVLGSTFVGGAWSSGSIGQQLMFQPRRSRLWTAKALAVTLGTTLGAAAVAAGFWASLGITAQLRDLTPSPDTWVQVAQWSGRGMALVAAAALGGYALTMVLRHTGATLGLLFGYAVVGEGLAATLPFARMSQWSLAHNVLAWIQHDRLVYDDSICDSARVAASCVPRYVLTLEHAALYLGTLLLLAVLVSVVTFRVRDVP